MADLKRSVIKSEIDRFEGRSSIWWDPKGPTMLLHKMIPSVRIPLMKDGLKAAGLIDESSDKIFKEIKILDVGSGGGLLSEPLALLGADVTGIDPAEMLINVARDHVKIHENLKINYICDTIESYCIDNKEKYDAVAFFDVAEHVADVRSVLKASLETLRPGGMIFLTTWNRTFMGWFYGIFILQMLLGIVPRSAHEWKMFVKPDEIREILEECGCKEIKVRGTWYSLFTRAWSFTSYSDVFYAMQAVKK